MGKKTSRKSGGNEPPKTMYSSWGQMIRPIPERDSKYPAKGTGRRAGEVTTPGPSAGVVPDSYIGYYRTEEARLRKVPHGNYSNAPKESPTKK
jgi:hypothetical protein